MKYRIILLFISTIYASKINKFKLCKCEQSVSENTNIQYSKRAWELRMEPVVDLFQEISSCMLQRSTMNMKLRLPKNREAMLHAMLKVSHYYESKMQQSIINDAQNDHTQNIQSIPGIQQIQILEQLEQSEILTIRETREHIQELMESPQELEPSSQESVYNSFLMNTHTYYVIDSILDAQLNHSSAWTREISARPMSITIQDIGSMDCNYNDLIILICQKTEKNSATALLIDRAKIADECLTARIHIPIKIEDILTNNPQTIHEIHITHRIMKRTLQNIRALLKERYYDSTHIHQFLDNIAPIMQFQREVLHNQYNHVKSILDSRIKARLNDINMSELRYRLRALPIKHLNENFTMQEITNHMIVITDLKESLLNIRMERNLILNELLEATERERKYRRSKCSDSHALIEEININVVNVSYEEIVTIDEDSTTVKCIIFETPVRKNVYMTYLLNATEMQNDEWKTFKTRIMQISHDPIHAQYLFLVYINQTLTNSAKYAGKLRGPERVSDAYTLLDERCQAARELNSIFPQFISKTWRIVNHEQHTFEKTYKLLYTLLTTLCVTEVFTYDEYAESASEIATDTTHDKTQDDDMSEAMHIDTIIMPEATDRHVTASTDTEYTAQIESTAVSSTSHKHVFVFKTHSGLHIQLLDQNFHPNEEEFLRTISKPLKYTCEIYPFILLTPYIHQHFTPVHLIECMLSLNKYNINMNSLMMLLNQ